MVSQLPGRVQRLGIILPILFCVIMAGCDGSRESQKTASSNPVKTEKPTPKDVQNQWKLNLTVPAVAFPDLPAPQAISEKINLHKVVLTIPGLSTMDLWIYMPRQTAVPAPVLFIAPAGSNMISGMRLGEGDMAEHIPYAEKGMIVVAYSISGEMQQKSSMAMMKAAITIFSKANCGVTNCAVAIQYALAKVPGIDRSRIITAGHSSAARLALQAAMNIPQVTHCIAYAPGLGEDFFAKIRTSGFRLIPGFLDTMNALDPVQHSEQLKVPTLIFQAEDDAVVKPADTQAFVEKLRKTNPSTTFKTVPAGGHYDSMIQNGIPAGIDWLKLP